MASLNLFFKNNNNDLSKIWFKYFIAHVKTVKELSLAFRIKHKIFSIAKTSYPICLFSPISCHSPQDTLCSRTLEWISFCKQMEDTLLFSAHLYMLFPLFLELTALLLTSHNCKSASIPEQEIISHLSHRGTDDIIPLFLFFFYKVHIYFTKIYFFFSKSFAYDSREYYPFSLHYNINKVKQPFLKVGRKIPEPLYNYAFDYFSALIIFNKYNYHLTRENWALVAWVIELWKNKNKNQSDEFHTLCVCSHLTWTLQLWFGGIFVTMYNV